MHYEKKLAVSKMEVHSIALVGVFPFIQLLKVRSNFNFLRVGLFI